jgi:hypothetical protein
MLQSTRNSDNFRTYVIRTLQAKPATDWATSHNAVDTANPLGVAHDVED